MLRNSSISVLTIVFCIGTFFSGGTRAAAAVDWSGTWFAKSGSVISVTEKDGFLEIRGKDNASIYSCWGIVEGTATQSLWCYGSGVNHNTNKKFVYKSQLKMGASGQEVIEDWDVGFANQGSIRWVKGTSTFKRTNPDAKPAE